MDGSWNFKCGVAVASWTSVLITGGMWWGSNGVLWIQTALAVSSVMAFTYTVMISPVVLARAIMRGLFLILVAMFLLRLYLLRL